MRYALIKNAFTAGARSRIVVGTIAAFLTATAVQSIHADCFGHGCCETCPARQTGLNVSLTGILSGNRGLFCISATGEGYDFGSGQFELSVRATGYSSLGSCVATMSDGTSATGCVQCEIEPFVRELTADSITRTIGFYTIATAISPSLQNCVDTSDTIYFTLPQSLPDSVEFPRPKPEEQGPNPCEVQFGDPINAITGNVHLEYNDVLINTDLGLQNEFSRHYNSSATSSTGPLGPKWKHSYDFSLDVDTLTGNVKLKESTGRELTFRRTVTPVGDWYDPPIGIHYRLEYNDSSDTYTVIKENDVRYVFDTALYLDFIEDRNANRIELTYTENLLTSIQDASGRQLVFVYDNDTLRYILSESGDTLVTYKYLSGVLRSVMYKTGDSIQYTYTNGSELSNLITQISNSDGVRLYYQYNSNDLANKVYGEDNINLVEAQYFGCPTDSCPLVFTSNVSDNSGVASSTFTSTFSSDGIRRLVKTITNPFCIGCGIEYEYDAGGNIGKIVYENGVADEFTYDTRGNMTSQIKAANTSLSDTTSYEYNSTYNLPTRVVTSSVAVPGYRDTVNYEYDTNGNLFRSIEVGWLPDSTQFQDTTSYAFNASGQVTKIDGPRSYAGDTTVFVYYTNGDLRYVIQANGDTTEYGQRDELGNRPWVKDPNGVITRNYYDERGRLDTLVQHSGSSDSTITTYKRNYNGDITSITFPEGNVLMYNYDEHDWLLSVVNTIGDSILYDYDSLSNRINEKLRDSSGVLSKFESYRYTRGSLLERITNPDSSYTEFTYDVMGNRLSQRDANGDSTYYEYDSLSRLDSVIQFLRGDSVITEFFYDTDNNLTKVIDPDSNVFAYAYDDKGRLVKDSSSVSGVTTYAYDPADNLTTKVNANGDTTRYQYDKLNRLTSVIFPDTTQNIYYLYDDTLTSYGRGRLYKELSPACSTTYTYEAFGRLFQEKRTIDSLDYTTTYSYDKNRNINTMTYPSGLQVVYFRDTVGQVEKVEWKKSGQEWHMLVDTIEYIPFGGPTSWTLGNGIKTTTTYDLRYLIDSLHTGSTLKRTYKYDSVGNITKINDHLDTSKTQSFGYDDLNRLTSAFSSSYPSGPISFTYYDNGNRALRAEGAATTYYVYSANKLIALSGSDSAEFQYDNLGNMVYDSTSTYVFTYEYDYSGRLVSVDSQTTAIYEYDGQAKRVKKITSSLDRVYLYDQFGRLISEMTTTGKWKADYIYLNGKLLAKIVPALLPHPRGPGHVPVEYVYCYHVDHLGTPLVMTDDNKRTKWKTEYLPFGETYNEWASQLNELRFPGQFHDRETELYYNWYRYYDPGTGRYLQVDPIGLISGDYNLYRYVFSNPLVWVDPWGLGNNKDFCERVVENFKITNKSIFSRPLRMLGSAIISREFARLLNSITFLEWAKGGFRGVTVGLATFTGLETLIMGGSTWALQSLVAGALFEAGVGIGSIINVALDEVIILDQNAPPRTAPPPIPAPRVNRACE